MLNKFGRAFLGISVGATGIALLMDRHEISGGLLTIAGIIIAVPGSLTPTVRVIWTIFVSAIALIPAYWIYGDIVFSSPDQVWWTYLWWVPIVVIYLAIRVVIAVYQSTDPSIHSQDNQ